MRELLFDSGVNFLFGWSCRGGDAYGNAFPDAVGDETPEPDGYIPAPVDYADSLAIDDGTDDAGNSVVECHSHRIDAGRIEQRSANPAGTDVGEGNVESLHSGELVECRKVGLLVFL